MTWELLRAFVGAWSRDDARPMKPLHIPRPGARAHEPEPEPVHRSLARLGLIGGAA